MPKKVLLALSGGVDSSVAVKLLLDEGYDVTGAFMKNWTDGCSWKEERRDAIRVAAILGIPIITLDFEKEYREEVAQYMFDEYAAGRTPNPDVLCNNKIKFPLLWREAQGLGFDFIATGHHVRKGKWRHIKCRATPRRVAAYKMPPYTVGRGFTPRHVARGFIPRQWQLLAGKDPNKDQSYFLHRLTQEDLEHTLFPIGDYTKEKVREMARKYGLPTANKRSTRGICFVGKVPMPEFLEQKIPGQPGPVQTTAGQVVGEHKGVAPFTIGQRHGFGVGGGTPYYVVEKDTKTNTLVVGDENDPGLYKNEIKVQDIHWISGKPPKFPLNCQARTRYRSSLVEVTVTVGRGFTPRQSAAYKMPPYTVRFNQPAKAPAPGQFVVFYDGEECLGGGVIV